MTIPTWFIWILLGIGFGKLLYVPVPPCDPQQGCVVHGTMDATKRGNP